MNSGQQSSIITAYTALVTIAVGVVVLDLHARSRGLPDVPTQAAIVDERNSPRSPNAEGALAFQGREQRASGATHGATAL